MKTPTYATYLADPDLREQIIADAHRTRAQAMGRYLFAPLARFCGALVSIRGLKLRLDPRAAAKPAA